MSWMATLHVNEEPLQIDLHAPLELSIPLDFQGEQPNAFSLPRASSAAFEAGGFVGDIAQGGPVHCDVLRMAPHGNGTHTECVGHITCERPSVSPMVDRLLSPAVLLSPRLVHLHECQETYEASHAPGDAVIARAALQEALDALEAPPEQTWFEALVLRTLPNDPGKPSRDHSGSNPAYLTREALAWIRERKVEHLLVDVPSVDREEDDGLLPNHHRFWGLEPGARSLQGRRPSRKTITEMIFAPSSIEDGRYLLSLQLPDFVSDAAPSRPRLFVPRFPR